MVTPVTSTSNSTSGTGTTATSSSISSTTNSAKTAAQALITSLGSGSGVDVNSLANNLANAEISPLKTNIQSKIDKSNAMISGYGAIKYVLSNLQTAFADLKDQSDFNGITPNNSQPGAFNITATASASTGSHSVQIHSIALAQRNLSNGFDLPTTQLNQGALFTLSVSVHNATPPTVITVPKGQDTPQGIVTAINASSTGIKASLVNTGASSQPYKILLTGQTGVLKDFTVTSSLGGLNFSDQKQDAADASLTVDGISINSAVNSVKDAISGVTLDLIGPTTGLTGATVTLNRDTTEVKTKVQNLVSTYNDVISMLGVVSDPKSKVDTYGGTLVGNSIVSSIRNQVRDMVVGYSNSPSAGISALRDIGVTLNKSGQLEIDATKLDGALITQFDDVVKMLSNNQENQTKFNPVAAGIAGESFKTLDTILDPIGGTLATLDQNQTAKINAYQKQMDALQTRLQEILTRYVNQFSAMDSMVGQIKSTQTSLKSTFDGMMAAYTKN